MNSSTILVIDDNLELLENTSELLEINGYIVFAVQDGTKGLEIAMEEAPNLIICDIAMPGADGFEVLHNLKKYSKTASIPFVFLTAKVEQKEINKGMVSGANAYIVKPYPTDILLKVVDSLLHKSDK